MQRPDFSDYVAHFTKSGAPCGAADSPDDAAIKIASGTAYERLVSILESRKILATPMPWTGLPAVAFTECPWWSMVDHARRYSPYGLGFAKPRLFAAGGGPALYVRPDLYNKQRQYVDRDNPEIEGFHPHVHAFVTPYVPDAAPKSFKDQHWGGGYLDFSHEREWRVPHDFKFQYGQVEFVVVDTYEDVAKLPKELKDQIGRERFLIMDVYRQIERLWPTHLLGGS